MKESPFIVAFDCAEFSEAATLADQLDPALCRAKVGKELFTACGMPVIDMLHKKGYQVFLDLKFHDIPNTVAKAVAVAAKNDVWMLNVHASGGPRMMDAARDAVDRLRATTLLIAVTMLTSLEQSDCDFLGLTRSLSDQVIALADGAKESGLDGVVCSAQEAAELKAHLGSDFLLVTPGIRPQLDSGDDQRRTLTPMQALEQGSDYLVIGRPVTQAADPRAFLLQLLSEISS